MVDCRKTIHGIALTLEAGLICHWRGHRLGLLHGQLSNEESSSLLSARIGGYSHGL